MRKKLQDIVGILILVTLIGCVANGQVQVQVQENATLAVELVETLSAPLTEAVQATGTPNNGTSTPQNSMSPILGLLEPNIVVAEGLLNQLKPVTGLTVVQGVTCQGLLANLDIKQEYLRSQGKTPVTVAIAINGTQPTNHDCAWTVSATLEYKTTPILVYTTIFDTEMQVEMARSGFRLMSYDDVVSGGLLNWLSGLP